MKAVAAAGYEISIHGYSHENPIAMTREQEMAVQDKCIDLVTQLSGKRPTGYVAPWWEFSIVTNELLLERGIKYDHSLMHHDHQPYYVRVGDSWTKIDYSKHPREWMVPLQRGQETDLIEIPASWYLDDLPPMLFIKKSPNPAAAHIPRLEPPAWINTGCPCADGTTLSGPFTLKNRPTWLMGRIFAGSATRPFGLSQTKASASTLDHSALQTLPSGRNVHCGQPIRHSRNSHNRNAAAMR